MGAGAVMEAIDAGSQAAYKKFIHLYRRDRSQFRSRQFDVSDSHVTQAKSNYERNGILSY